MADGKDLALLEELRENVYMFSAAKTYQETKAISGQLVDEEGNIRSQREFNKIGREMFSTWNDDWGKTEYNTAIGQGTMSAKWLDIQERKALFPKLRYSTIGDACDICAPLNDFVAPVDDEAWDEIMPLNHFNCECTVLQEDEDMPDTGEDERADILEQVTDKMDDMFKNNAGKTGTVFPDSHPFFNDIPKEDRDFAANNFNLPIPPASEEIDDLL